MTIRRTTLRNQITILIFLACMAALHWPQDSTAAPVEKTAFYVVQSGSEGDEPPANTVRLDITGEEKIDGVTHYWWEMSVTTRSGHHYGIRVLSEHAAMTSPGSEEDPSGIGNVARYLYRDLNGKVFEYRDQTSGKAVLPMQDFRKHFLPAPSRNAAYDGGFATAGDFQGHVATRFVPVAVPVRVTFDAPRLLVLRTDLLMGAQASSRNDYVPLKPGDDKPKDRPYSLDELKALIDAGINFFGDIGEHQAWLKEQPVLFRSAPSFPDSFYRSNYYPSGMFIDEPSIRFGWDKNVPERNLFGPEEHAAALEMRVKSHYVPTKRNLKIGWNTGGLELYYRNNNSWDTNYFSAWYQLAAGAPALVVEGRYRKRGYGWSPEAFFGREGLDELTFEDQLNCMNAFMRGAARAFDGNWGVSVYPEGHTELFAEAFKHSYDMGALHMWFWIDPPVVSYDTMLELGRVMKEHVKQHPRGDIAKANRQAEVGIVFPKGYTATPEGSVWSFEADQVSRGGATYGDIAASAMAEALICSRRGIPFDFLVDEPFIRDLGYKQLIYLGEDASLRAEPDWKASRPAKGLALSLVESASAPIIRRATPEAEFKAPRAEGIVIDGSIDDWKVNWTTLGSAEVSSDLVDLEISVPNITSASLFKQYHVNYLGYKFDQLDATLQQRFSMQDYHIIGSDVVDENRPGISLEQPAVVITEIRPGSAAEEAGLRAGDVIRTINGQTMKWTFQVWGLMHNFGQVEREPIQFGLTRNEHTRTGYPGDLEARFALALDEAHLYFAADVTDNTHSQAFDGWYYWQGDCVQIGIDSTLARNGMGYTEEDHEIAFVLRDDGRPVAWRFQGRRGQPREDMPGVELRITRNNNRTIYEAAIPLEELMPLSPDMWPKAGFNIVINDNDGEDVHQRKGRLELKPGALTRGKIPAEFAVLEFEPSPDKEKVSAALLWLRKATLEGGLFRMLLALASPTATECRVKATLQSLDTPKSRLVEAEILAPVTAEPKEWSLEMATQSPPGRYELDVRVEDGKGKVVAKDRLMVVVLPR